MSKKVVIAAVAAVAVAAVAVAAAVLLLKPGTGAETQAKPALSASQPAQQAPSAAAGQASAPAPAADGEPAPCTFDDAYPIVKAITDGTYDFTQDGWNSLVEDAAAVSLTVDEESVQPPFVQYEARTMRAMEVFAAMNDDASFVKTGDSSWNVTVSVRRAASPIKSDTTDQVRANLKRKLKTDGDSPEFRAQVTYAVEITDGKGTVRCTSPEWYL